MPEDRFIDNVRQLAAEIDAINYRAVGEYEPMVEFLVRTHDLDARQIEQTLDDRLSFCGFAPALGLCRRLCHHY